MRTAILLSGILIAQGLDRVAFAMMTGTEAADPSEEVVMFFAITLLVAMVMDVIDFFSRVSR